LHDADTREHPSNVTGRDPPVAEYVMAAPETPSSQAGSISRARSMRRAVTPACVATSTSRSELELFAAPTTSTSWTRGAIALTASCRFCVA
jgi:hypothetical protein